MNKSENSLWNQNIGYIATRSAQILLIGALAFVLIKMLLSVQLVILPIIIALILASALWPVVRQLRHKLSNMLSAWVTLLGCITVFSAITAWITFSVKSQWNLLYDKAIQGIEKVQVLISEKLDESMQHKFDEVFSSVMDFITSAQFGSSALSGISAAGSFFTGTILVFVILFFFLKDGDRIWRFIITWIPSKNKILWNKSGIQTVLTLGDYIRGTSIVAAVDAIGIGVGLAILQVPLALPLSIIVFFGSFIPMVGATVVGILAALVTLVTNDLTSAIIVVIIVIAVNQLEGTFLQPVVMSKALSLHALVILLGLTAGTVLGGLVGAVLSVPLLATFWAVTKLITGKQSKEDRLRLNKVIAKERLSNL